MFEGFGKDGSFGLEKNKEKRVREMMKRTMKVRNREGIEHGSVVVLAVELEAVVLFGGIS